MTTVYLNTLFYFCNDVVPMRHFYIELLGLEETFFRNDDEAGWLTLRIEHTNIVFVRAAEPLPIPGAFARQPGLSGGDLEQHSWVLQLFPPEFEATVIRMQAAAVPSLTPAPVEVKPGHWQFVVHDPMGFTIELYAVSDNERNN